LKKIYYFGWPSNLGGADTKMTHFLDLMCDEYEIIVTPNFDEQLKQKIWLKYLDSRNIKYKKKDLPQSLSDGISLSFCNDRFFIDGNHKLVKQRGSKLIWSTEMMWHHNGELQAVKDGFVDKVLYTSELQRSRLFYPKTMPYSITGNYISPSFFPFKEREMTETMTIGRLSRSDKLKYPEDFPVFYEQLKIPNVKYRIMAWSIDLGKKYKWFKFGKEWDLLWAEQETQSDFLQSLDLFVYPLGHNFIESWGRSTVEAMLTGAIPLVQTGHHLENLIIHNETGFVCDDILEYKEYCHKLYFDKEYRKKMSIRCNEHATNNICNREEHKRIWREALDV
jgi:hypothetical protein